MSVKPMIRSNICLNAHPAGCRTVVQKQIEQVKQELGGQNGGPKLALIIGCSTGYGLSSRIAAAFGYGAATVGISFERPGNEKKPGTPGWYNNMSFDAEATAAGLATITLDGDAFSNEMKDKAIQAVKEVAAKAGIPAKIDLVIYSLASPVRTDPSDGVMYRSVIKPIGQDYSGKTLDMLTGKIGESSAVAATEEEIAHTVKVMGGEDWELWMDQLATAGVLDDKVRTLAYTYLGPELSWAIYKNGTIGRAKQHLEESAVRINSKLRSSGGAAWVSVNKALVTRASAVIPIIPLYISTLFKVMKEAKLHEGCNEQIIRLYRDRLYTAKAREDNDAVPVDEANRIRVDDWEMREDIQKETERRMNLVTEENINDTTDLAGYRHDFLEAHGFDVDGIDYEADVDYSKV